MGQRDHSIARLVLFVAVLVHSSTAISCNSSAITATQACIEPFLLRAFPLGARSVYFPLSKCDTACTTGNQQFVRLGFSTDSTFEIMVWVTTTTFDITVYFKNYTTSTDRNIVYSTAAGQTSPAYAAVTTTTTDLGKEVLKGYVKKGTSRYFSLPLTSRPTCSMQTNNVSFVMDLVLSTSATATDTTEVYAEIMWVNATLDRTAIVSEYPILDVPHTYVQSVSFVDEDPRCSKIGGVVYVQRTTDETYVTGYRMYLSNSGVQAVSTSSQPIADVEVASLSPDQLTFNFSLPFSTTRVQYIIAYTYNLVGQDQVPRASNKITDLCSKADDTDITLTDEPDRFWWDVRQDTHPKASIVLDNIIDDSVTLRDTPTESQYTYQHTIAGFMDYYTSPTHVYQWNAGNHSRWRLSVNTTFNSAVFNTANSKLDFMRTGLAGVLVLPQSSGCPMSVASMLALNASSTTWKKWISLNSTSLAEGRVVPTAADQFVSVDDDGDGTLASVTYASLSPNLKQGGYAGAVSAQWTVDCVLPSDSSIPRSMFVVLVPHSEMGLGFNGTFTLTLEYDDFTALVTQTDHDLSTVVVKQLCVPAAISVSALMLPLQPTQNIASVQVTGGAVDSVFGRFNVLPTLVDFDIASNSELGIRISPPCVGGLLTSGILYVMVYRVNPETTMIVELTATMESSVINGSVTTSHVVDATMCCGGSVAYYITGTSPASPFNMQLTASHAFQRVWYNRGVQCVSGCGSTCDATQPPWSHVITADGFLILAAPSLSIASSGVSFVLSFNKSAASRTRTSSPSPSRLASACTGAFCNRDVLATSPASRISPTAVFLVCSILKILFF